jgi:hypothetical protein
LRKTVSVITPAYNAEDTLEQTYESLLQQSTQDWEWLVVDNASDDETLSLAGRLASSDERVRLLEQPLRGVFHARNLGIEEAEGENICFLDADDVLGPGALEGRVSAMDRTPEHRLAYCEAHFVDPDLNPLDWVYESKDVVTFAETHGNPCAMSALMGRADFIKAFRFPHRSYGEDWLFLARMLRSGATMVRAQDCHVLYRQSTESAVQANMLRHELSCLEVLDLIYGRDPGVDSLPEWESGLDSPPLEEVKGKRLLRLLTHALLAGRLEEANYAYGMLQRVGYTSPNPRTVDWALETVIARAEHIARESVHEGWYSALARIAQSGDSLQLGTRFAAYMGVVQANLAPLDPSYHGTIGGTRESPVSEWGSIVDTLPSPTTALVIDPSDAEPVSLLLDRGWHVIALVPNDAVRARLYEHGPGSGSLRVDVRNPTSTRYATGPFKFEWNGWLQRLGLGEVGLIWIGKRPITSRVVAEYPWAEHAPAIVILDHDEGEVIRSATSEFEVIGYRSFAVWRVAGRSISISSALEG